MSLVELSSELEKLLGEFDRLGGVIDYIVTTNNDVSLNTYRTHKEAAVLTLETLSSRWWKGYFINSELATGQPISVADFIGPYFDANIQSLTIPNSKTSLGTIADYITHGYADAFSDPPHGLTGTLVELNHLYLSLNSLLFGALDFQTEVYQWSTDWSDYFDAGKEWWGAFLWTVRNYEENTIVGVAASTTD